MVKYRLTTDYISLEFYGKYQVEEVAEFLVGTSEKSPAQEDKFEEKNYNRPCIKCNIEITLSNKTGKWSPYEVGSDNYHICKDDKVISKYSN